MNQLLITHKPQVYVLLGWPLNYTLSPLIHNCIFSQRQKGEIYYTQPVFPADFFHFVKLFRLLGWQGANVTTPFKEEIITHLDYVDPLAAKIGAVNTIHNEDGRLSGYNTDAGGFIMTLPTSLSKDHPVLCLGAGGAARAIVFSLAEVGYRYIRVANRTVERTEMLCSDLRVHYPNCDISSISWRHLAAQHFIESELIINCTSVDFPWPLELHKQSLFSGAKCVYDLRYGRSENGFIALAQNQQVPSVINGVDMLIWQAALAQQIWTGAMPSISLIKEKLKL